MSHNVTDSGISLHITCPHAPVLGWHIKTCPIPRKIKGCMLQHTWQFHTIYTLRWHAMSMEQYVTPARQGHICTIPLYRDHNCQLEMAAIEIILHLCLIRPRQILMSYMLMLPSFKKIPWSRGSHISPLFTKTKHPHRPHDRRRNL